MFVADRRQKEIQKDRIARQPSGKVTQEAAIDPRKAIKGRVADAVGHENSFLNRHLRSLSEVGHREWVKKIASVDDPSYSRGQGWWFSATIDSSLPHLRPFDGVFCSSCHRFEMKACHRGSSSTQPYGDSATCVHGLERDASHHDNLGRNIEPAHERFPQAAHSILADHKKFQELFCYVTTRQADWDDFSHRSQIDPCSKSSTSYADSISSHRRTPFSSAAAELPLPPVVFDSRPIGESFVDVSLLASDELLEGR